MPKEKPSQFRFRKAVKNRLQRESARTGEDMTAIVERAIMHRHNFKPYIEDMIQQKIDETGWTYDEVLEWAVIQTYVKPLHPTAPAGRNETKPAHGSNSSKGDSRKSRRASTAPKKT